MKKVIGLDIGGTNCRAAILNENYQIEKILIKDTLRGDKDIFINQVVELIKEIGFNDEIIAIGAGVPGRVRNDGYISALPNVGIYDIKLAETLNKIFNVPIYVKNDAEIAGYAEAILGKGKGLNKTYFITISTGVGGAYIENEELKNICNEIGHTYFEYKNEYYELEKIVSGTGLVKMCELNGIKINKAYEFFKLVVEKDEKALIVYNDWLKLLTQFLTIIKNYYNPDIVVFTGGVMKSKEIFFNDLKNMNKGINIDICYFEQEAGLMGAGSYALKMEEKKHEN